MKETCTGGRTERKREREKKDEHGKETVNTDHVDLTVSSRDTCYEEPHSTDVLKKKIRTTKMDCCTKRKREVESTELLNLTESSSEFSFEQLSQPFFDDIDMDPVEVAQISFTGSNSGWNLILQ